MNIEKIRSALTNKIHATFSDELDETKQHLLADAQTSGGLLISVSNEKASELESELKNNDAKFWSELLNKAGVPVGEVLAVPDALNLDQIQQRQFLLEKGALL